MRYYKLDENKKTIPCDLMEWSQRFEDQDGRRVEWTEIDKFDISTVFLGLDHNYFGGRPLLFETMIFDPDGNDVYMRRCSTWEEAQGQHLSALDWLCDYIGNGCKDVD